jgi:hypothetical protein
VLAEVVNLLLADLFRCVLLTVFMLLCSRLAEFVVATCFAVPFFWICLLLCSYLGI